MTKILIKDMPMIKYVDVDLKKLNILIGFDDEIKRIKEEQRLMSQYYKDPE